MYVITRTDEVIDDVLNKAAQAVDDGGSSWPGMSYEQGVQAAIDWLVGHAENPMVDE